MLLNPCPVVCVAGAAALWASGCAALAAEDATAEAAVRALVRANAEKDMRTLSRMMAHDADITSYSIGGRKYVGWSRLEQDFQEEPSADEGDHGPDRRRAFLEGQLRAGVVARHAHRAGRLA